MNNFVSDDVVEADSDDYYDDDSDIAAEITTETVETTSDDVKLDGNTSLTSMDTKLSLFLGGNRSRYQKNKSNQAIDCYPVYGETTNLIVFEYDQDDRIDTRDGERRFDSEAELIYFIQRMSTNHCVSFYNKYRKATWQEEFLLGSAIAPELRNVKCSLEWFV